MDTGWQTRLEYLKNDVERNISASMRVHGWRVEIESEVQRGEYIIIKAERANYIRRIACFYSIPAKAIAESVATHVDFLTTKSHYGQNNDKDSHGIASTKDFPSILIQWNKESSSGKFSPIPASVPSKDELPQPHEARILRSETPIEAIWLRLRQLESTKLSHKLVVKRASREGLALSPLEEKGKSEGITYALRNASDYFHASSSRNVSQRILNLYYGTMAFAFAEMLASPTGPTTLDEIELSTKKGHGLYTIDSKADGLEGIIIGIKRLGFFSMWLSNLQKDTAWLPKDALKLEELQNAPIESWLTFESLMSRIPEVSDLFIDIFDGPTLWLHPSYDAERNPGLSLTNNQRPSRSYITLTDFSARQTVEHVAAYPAPLGEIRSAPSTASNNHFYAGVDHEGLESWWEALKLHKSPLGPEAMLMPVFRDVFEYRAICFSLLYTLSIIVRYRPSIWRRIQEGDLDHMRVIIEAFLTAAERVLPEQFLKSITGDRIRAKQPGTLF